MSEQRCRAIIYVRDTYRYHGGKDRFKLHYREQRCKRKAKVYDECWQHAKMHELVLTGQL